ncbi:MAG TPA: hypothetical protein VHI93_02715 [Candidatus Thermoplasmatota archaeon]|nr:hypothetical protein [Candidatus Thermoplasmatota archaeon]
MQAKAWGFAVAQAALLVATALPPFTPGFGVPTWHHHVSLGLAAAFSLLTFRRMATDRRWLALGVALTTILALASAFLLLYLKEDLKAWGLKDWAKWWHVAWSWFALAFFAGHTWVNRGGLARSLRRATARLAGLPYWLPLAAIAVAVPLTWSGWGARTFTDATYIPLTLYTWLAVAGPPYTLWAIAALRIRGGARPRGASRPATQAFVDAWLLPMTVLANVSGFPILYFGTKDTALKYVAKYWHTWPSIAMAVLVFAHTIQFLPAMQRHLRSAPRPLGQQAGSLHAADPVD